MMKWIIGIMALMLLVSPAFAITYSGNLVNNSNFSLTRLSNASLPDAWFYDNFNEALPSYPPMVDRGEWNLNLFYLENGLKLRANVTNEGNNEFVRSDIYNLTALADSQNKTRTFNATFEFISNFTADSMYFYTYHSAIGDPENEVDQAIVEFMVSYDDTYSCDPSSYAGNISIINCIFSHVGDVWSLSSVFTVNASVSKLFSLAIAAQPASCCSMVDNVTFTNMGLEVALDDTPVISVSSPANASYNVPDVNLNWTASSALSWAGYELDGAGNVSMTENITLTSLSEGQHNIIVYGNDSAGYMGNSGRIYFITDDVPPVVAIDSPTNTTYNTTGLVLNFTASDGVGIDSCIFENNTINYTLSGCNNVTFSALNNSNTVKVFVNDTSGNSNVSVISFTITLPLPPSPPGPAPPITGATAGIIAFLPILIGAGFLYTFVRKIEDMEEIEDFIAIVVVAELGIAFLGVFVAIVTGLI